MRIYANIVGLLAIGLPVSISAAKRAYAVSKLDSTFIISKEPNAHSASVFDHSDPSAFKDGRLRHAGKGMTNLLSVSHMNPAADLESSLREDQDPAGSQTTPLPWSDEPTTAPALLIPFLGFLVGVACLCIVIFDEPTNPSGNGGNPNQVRVPVWLTKADAIFAACDQDRDGFISYNELKWLARVTSPKTSSQLTQGWFRDLCRPLGADPRRGLDREEFRQSYMLLGSDVDSDYEAIRQISQEAASSSSAAQPQDAPAASVSSVSGPSVLRDAPAQLAQ
mmetsp:Transcript_62623/g.135970  ORF Transcript_62623/g.135970 Transcript_62623/m.135970 type:complete len:279 (+) Transcript_62623:128-964(+)